MTLLVYADDLLIMSSSVEDINAVKESLHNAFTIKDIGPTKYFLGLQIARSEIGMYINQHKYATDLLTDAGLINYKPTSTPLPPHCKLSANDNSKLVNPEMYRRVVGRLLYLGFTRPDLTYATQTLSQFMHSPTMVHWNAALYVLRYLKGTLNHGLFYPADNDLQMTGYSDADWGSCTDTRRSVTGYCIYLGTSLVSWKTKKQPTVSRSSTKAEYRAMASTTCELQWISYLLNDLQVTMKLPITLFCDSKSVIQITENPVFHERTKHLDIDCHVVRDRFKAGFLTPTHVSSKDQLADLFTKSLIPTVFRYLCSKLGICKIPSP